MKRLALFAIVLAGCSTPDRPQFAGAPPENTALPTAAPPQENPIVGYLNGKPLHWREVTEHAMSNQGKELIDQYIAWKLRDDRIKALGITNTAEELRSRVKLNLEVVRRTAGDAEVKKQLESMKLTEDEYIARFADSVNFQEMLKSEKLFAYTIMTELSVEIDTVAFTDEEDATAFLATLKGITFEEACLKALSAPKRGRTAQWPRYRFSRGMAPEAIATASHVENLLFEMKKGQTTGIEHTASELKLVIHVVDIHPAAAGTYPELREKVMAEILRRPPQEAQRQLLLQRLFRESKILYEDRYTPRNQGR